MRAVLWGVLTFVAFVAACFSATALPALSWTALAVFGYVRMVLASKWLSAKYNLTGDEAAAPLSLGRTLLIHFGLACFVLFFPVLVWWGWLQSHYGPDWKPVEREELHAVTGELQVRYGKYVLMTPARPVYLHCVRFVRGPIPDQTCLPKHIKDYAGRQVKVLFGEPLGDKYQATFFEIVSGDDVLFSYDRVLERQAGRISQARNEGAFYPAFVTLVSVPYLVVFWINHLRAPKKRVVAFPPNLAPEVTAPNNEREREG
ncbi:hypothetical protein [Pedomonas mirosovicensis]|uniref:hypothetical protein n=1 Tax=Pedomonas mirosovicensis TaxID=2908641 RepID=UPI0021698DAD|nr:hypothetical protein [Pedomonas mirosovicensis]MCH8686047.1 hypothetical protein [Pedomonas mirosovicensis]